MPGRFLHYFSEHQIATFAVAAVTVLVLMLLAAAVLDRRGRRDSQNDRKRREL